MEIEAIRSDQTVADASERSHEDTREHNQEKKAKTKAKKARTRKRKQERLQADKRGNDQAINLDSERSQTADGPAMSSEPDVANHVTSTLANLLILSAPSTTTKTAAAAVAPHEVTHRAKRFVPAVPDLRAAYAKTKKQRGVGAVGRVKPNVAPLKAEDVGVLLSYRGARRSSFGAFHELEFKGVEVRHPTPSSSRRNSF